MFTYINYYFIVNNVFSVRTLRSQSIICEYDWSIAKRSHLKMQVLDTLENIKLLIPLALQIDSSIFLSVSMNLHFQTTPLGKALGICANIRLGQKCYNIGKTSQLIIPSQEKSFVTKTQAFKVEIDPKVHLHVRFCLAFWHFAVSS